LVAGRFALTSGWEILPWETVDLREITPIVDFRGITPIGDFRGITPVGDFRGITPIGDFRRITPVGDFREITPMFYWDNSSGRPLLLGDNSYRRDLLLDLQRGENSNTRPSFAPHREKFVGSRLLPKK